MTFDACYNPEASQLAVLREVYRALKPELRRARAHRSIRHQLYREVLATRREMHRVIGN